MAKKTNLRETAKQTPTCHFQDETERLLNVAQKMLCKQKIGFCLPALDFQFSLASGGCFFSSFSVCTDLCFHLNLLAYPCSQTDSSSALTNLKAGHESHRALPQLGTHSHANPSPNEDLTGNAPLLVLSRNQTRWLSPWDSDVPYRGAGLLSTGQAESLAPSRCSPGHLLTNFSTWKQNNFRPAQIPCLRLSAPGNASSCLLWAICLGALCHF